MKLYMDYTFNLLSMCLYISEDQNDSIDWLLSVDGKFKATANHFVNRNDYFDR